MEEIAVERQLQRPEGILTARQVDDFIRDGYIKVGDLITPDVVDRTRVAIADSIGIDESDPSTWGERPTPLDCWDVTLRCWTPDIEQVGRELVGPDTDHGPHRSPYLERKGKDPWMFGYIPVLSYPVGGEKRFTPKPTPDGYHVDGIHLVTTWPVYRYLVVFVYLVDVEPFGGATVVLPGSHRRIFEHWYRDRKAAASGRVPDLDYGDPVAVAGRAGDVIFMHYLCAHSGSQNHDEHIRFGLNSGIGPDPKRPYRWKSNGPSEEWTPLDWTLRTDNLVEATAGVA